MLDGVGTAATIKVELAARVVALRAHGIVPGLATVLVGDDPASRSYVTAKHRDCAEVGIRSIQVELPADASYAEIASVVHALNEDVAVTGFIIQLPLPAAVNENAILNLMDPAKDADGLHPTNLGRLVLTVDPQTDSYIPIPCTPAAVLELLDRNGIAVAGKRVAVIGRGITVGRPLGLLLTRKGLDATVTLTHSRTKDLPTELASAEIIVAAAGVPHLVQPHWVMPGAVVVDVGITRVGTAPFGRARLHGDVHPDVASVAGWLSPVPGGVGPMTRAMLLANIVRIAERATKNARRVQHASTR